MAGVTRAEADTNVPRPRCDFCRFGRLPLAFRTALEGSARINLKQKLNAFIDLFLLFLIQVLILPEIQQKNERQ